MLDLLSNQLIGTLTIAIVVFALTLVLQAARHAYEASRNIELLNKTADRFDTSARTYTSGADRFARGAAEHRYAGLAARVLGLQDSSLFGHTRHGKPTAGPDRQALQDALDAGVDALRTWVLRGNFGETSEARGYCRDLWWRIMRTYQQEEIYDTARYELATNVRNFAFILIGIIADLREQVCNAQVRDGQEVDSPNRQARVVVLNCTPFAPKDFYNFPDGVADERFYHEREFFGTYRRVLAMLARDRDSVEMYRILLADPAIEFPLRNHEDKETKKNLSVGWPLDPIWDLARDSARFFVVPTPLPLSGKESGSLFYASEKGDLTEVPLDEDLAPLLAPPFPHKHDPRKHLRGRDHGSRSRFFWAPFFSRVHPNPRASSTDYRWWRKPSEFEQEMSGENNRLDEAFTKAPKIAQAITTALSQGKKEARTDLETEVRRHCGKVDQCADWETVRAAVSDHIAADQIGIEKRRLFEGEIFSLARSWWDLEREIHRNDDLAAHSVARRICTLLDLTQALDAQIEVLRYSLPRPDGDAKPLGSELGLAETYLHRVVALEEWEYLRTSFESSGPFPVWRLFFADCLLGKRYGEDGDEAALDDYLSAVRERFRVVPLRDFQTFPKLAQEQFFWAEEEEEESEEKCNPAKFIERQILPEFLLIGVRSSTTDANGHEHAADGRSKGEYTSLEGVSWRALVAAPMNEPFHTCRVVVRFSEGDQDDPSFVDHANWVEEVFNESGQGLGKFALEATGAYLNELKKIIKGDAS